MGGKMSRSKGQRGEREVIAEIQKVFGVKYARTPLSGGMDIKGDIRKPYKQKPTLCDLFHWEVKYQEHMNIWKCFEQAEKDAKLDPLCPVPIVVYRRNNTPWRVCIDLQMFLELIYELQSWRISGSEKSREVSNLLCPLGSSLENFKEETFEDWAKDKDEARAKRDANKKKKKELEDKYGKRN